MRVLLVGLGRMGQRHARAIAGLGLDVVGVDPGPAGRDAARAILPEATLASDLDKVMEAGPFDAAILTATADSRPAAFAAAMARKIPHILLEKPICQSRAQLKTMIDSAERGESRISVNLYRRTLPGYAPIRQRCAQGGGPLHVTVTSGASGLGCNGIHWIDFVLSLTGQTQGRLMLATLDALPIASGRGPQFRDFGGSAVYGFPDGSRLNLNILAGSSVPAVMTIAEDTHLTIVDQDQDLVIAYDRDPASTKPRYLYGQDYQRSERRGVEVCDLAQLSRAWLESVRDGTPSPLPSLSEARPAHDLLFDLLETSGQQTFDFT